MSCNDKVDCGRRRLLVATSVAGGAASVVAAVPFISSFAPSERAKSAGAPVVADFGKLEPGQMTIVEWRGKPVWIIRRTEEMLESVKKHTPKVADPESTRSKQPEYAKNEYRSIKPEYLITVGICTHLGCSPSKKFKSGDAEGMPADWTGGFFCPCHGSFFDMAGRVYANMPAPDNLEIPPHYYLSDASVLIGEDEKGA